MMALDIGPKTVDLFSQAIRESKTIIWNGPMSNPSSLLAMFGLVVVMLAVSWAVRRSTFTTLDFYLARRQVGPFLNACAICGDYFSAASFLGVAGVVYASGDSCVVIP